jgi:hypothetical protein
MYLLGWQQIKVMEIPNSGKQAKRNRIDSCLECRMAQLNWNTVWNFVIKLDIALSYDLAAIPYPR